MDKQETRDRIIQEKLIAILRGIQADRAVYIAEALVNGGIRCMEIAYDQTSEQGLEETLRAIRAVRQALGDEVLLGAGTVLTPEQVRRAVGAGARYIVSPNFRADVVRDSAAEGAVSMPGVMTPTEIEAAYEAGADILKLFPAGDLGVSYFKSVRSPLSHVPLAAVGGISPENAGEFLRAGACCLGIGGNLVSMAAVDAQDYGRITDAARRFCSAAKEWQE